MSQKKNNIDIILEIILLLLKGETHLRHVAKAIDASPSTVQRKLNALLKENVLDYKIQGKNKVFCLKKNLQAKNYVFNAERYKLIALTRKYPKLDIIIEDILKKADCRIAILFGSYAKFIAKEDSDIDIYLDTNNSKVMEAVESVNSKLSVKIGRFDISSLLIKEIIKNHVILKGVEEFYEKTGFFGQA